MIDLVHTPTCKIKQSNDRYMLHNLQPLLDNQVDMLETGNGLKGCQRPVQDPCLVRDPAVKDIHKPVQGAALSTAQVRKPWVLSQQLPVASVWQTVVKNDVDSGQSCAGSATVKDAAASMSGVKWGVTKRNNKP